MIISSWRVAKCGIKGKILCLIRVGSYKLSFFKRNLVYISLKKLSNNLYSSESNKIPQLIATLQLGLTVKVGLPHEPRELKKLFIEFFYFILQKVLIRWLFCVYIPTVDRPMYKGIWMHFQFINITVLSRILFIFSLRHNIGQCEYFFSMLKQVINW